MGNLGHYGMTVRFESAEEKRLFLEDIRGKSILSDLFGTDHYYGRYETTIFDFAGEVSRLLAEKGLINTSESVFPLEELHEYLPAGIKALDESELNAVSRAFYETDDRFLYLYHRFVREILAPLFEADLYFQITPTMRFQFPHQDGFTWKPRIHTDIMLGHPPYEVNVWIPLTPAYSTNSMMIARVKDSMRLLEEVSFDFQTLAYRVQRDSIFWERCASVCHPVTLDYGSFLMFDPRCLHATQYNSTPHTRVSIDVRIIRREDLESMKLAYRGTGRKKLRFAPGHYYHAQSCSELFP